MVSNDSRSLCWFFFGCSIYVCIYIQNLLLSYLCVIGDMYKLWLKRFHLYTLLRPSWFWKRWLCVNGTTILNCTRSKTLSGLWQAQARGYGFFTRSVLKRHLRRGQRRSGPWPLTLGLALLSFPFTAGHTLDSFQIRTVSSRHHPTLLGVIYGLSSALWVP